MKTEETKTEDLIFIVSIIVVVAGVLAALIFVWSVFAFVWNNLLWVVAISLALFFASLLLLREPKNGAHKKACDE